MSAVDMFFSAPPVSRTLTAATLVLSILVHTHLMNAYWVLFWAPKIFTLPPQVWRLMTSFMISGPQFGILLDPYFLYTYGSKLELGSPRFTKPGDFFTYVVFLCVTIMGINYVWTGASVFTSALILAFIYTGCQDDRGGQFNFMVVNVPAQWAPFGMLFITFIMNGPEAAKIQSTGLLAAHLYDFLTRLYPEFGGGWNIIQTPAFVRRLFAPDEAVVSNRSYGTAFTAPERATGSTGASTGSVLPESWKARGSGHRLGGE